MLKYFNILIGDHTQIIQLFIDVFEIRRVVFLKACKYRIYSIVRQQSVHHFAADLIAAISAQA